jgi:hypothetical protein
MTQLAPAAREPQLLMLKKSPAVTTLLTISVPTPVLVRVMFCTALKVPGNWFPKVNPELDKVTAPAALTVRLIAEDDPPMKFVSPAYIAMIECDPTAKAEVLNVANPNGLTLLVPRRVAPSIKATAPVGVPLVVEETLAVRIAGLPATENPLTETVPLPKTVGLGPIPTPVKVGACVIVRVPLFALIA